MLLICSSAPCSLCPKCVCQSCINVGPCPLVCSPVSVSYIFCWLHLSSPRHPKNSLLFQARTSAPITPWLLFLQVPANLQLITIQHWHHPTCQLHPRSHPSRPRNVFPTIGAYIPLGHGSNQVSQSPTHMWHLQASLTSTHRLLEPSSLIWSILFWFSETSLMNCFLLFIYISQRNPYLDTNPKRPKPNAPFCEDNTKTRPLIYKDTLRQGQFQQMWHTDTVVILSSIAYTWN